MGVGPVYVPGEEAAVGEVVHEFSIEEAAKSYVRLSRAAMEASRTVVDAVEMIQFMQSVRLPGSGAVARLFGRLEAWKVARVERQAQAAAGSLRAPTQVAYTFKSGDVDSVRLAFKSVADAAKRGAK